MKKYVALFAVLSLMLACAPKGGDTVDRQDKRDQEKSQENTAEYNLVAGLYRGTLNAPDRVIPIELRLVITQIENGKDSSGKPKFFPKLTGSLTELDSTENDVMMIANFDQDAGTLTFAGTDPANTSMEATFRDEMIRGEVHRNIGVVGKLEATRVEKSAKMISDDERRERIVRLLGTRPGVYMAIVPVGDVKFKVELNLGFSQVGKTPELIALCKSDTGSEAMTARFQVFPAPTLWLTANPSSGTKGCPFRTLVGQFNAAGELQAHLETFRGPTDAVFSHSLPNQPPASVSTRGRYIGSVTLEDQRIPAELRIMTSATGAISATLTFTESLESSFPMTGEFDPPKKQLQLVNGVHGPKLNLTLNQNNLMGTFSRYEKSGRAMFQRTNAETSPISEDQENERLARILGQATGDFAGTLRVGSRPVALGVKIFVDRSQSKPELHALCAAQGGKFEDMSVTYIPGSTPQIWITTRIDNRDKPCPFSSFEGTLKDNALSGTARFMVNNKPASASASFQKR